MLIVRKPLTRGTEMIVAENKIVKTNVETMWAWQVKETGEWVVCTYGKRASWNDDQIKYVKITREWLSYKYAINDAGDRDRVTQTITGEYTYEYVKQCLPKCHLISVETIDDVETTVVEFTF